MHPFKFKAKDMVYFLSSNKVALGCVNEVHYMEDTKGAKLKYKIKATFHGKDFSGEEKEEHEIFHTQDELVLHLTKVTPLQ